MPAELRLVVTDSGLGGLSICAAIEHRLREEGGRRVHLTYVNAWPFEGRGYNDLPDVAARAAVFDRALARMAAWAPDRILIACNTLSIIFLHTAFRLTASVPVSGIVDAGVSLFVDAMTAEPSAGLILLGTKTTIESGVHHDAIVSRGVDPHRVRAVHCHGLAGAIERDPHGAAVAEEIAACAARVREADPGGVPLYAGLCCTHYAYVSGRICAALGAALGRPVQPLDPNGRMASDLAFGPARQDQGRPPGGQDGVLVEVISKVTLEEAARRAIAPLIDPISPATAQALLSYSLVPDLF